MSNQTEVVTKTLVRENGFTVGDAFNTWYNSKTKKYLEDNKLFYVSSMRYYWKLCLGLSNNKRWLNEPFDM